MKLETLASGYTLCEAPRADGREGVWFTDVFNGGIYRWTEQGVVTELAKRRGIGGLLAHADGGVIASGRGLIHLRDGEVRTVLEAPEGITGFNDMFTEPDGSVLAGALHFLPMRDEAKPGDVWRVRTGGAEVIWDGVVWPNGIGRSPDGATTYVADYEHRRVIAYPEGRVFADAPRGSCDGLAVDENGSVWVALGDAAAIARFDAGGALEEVVDVEADFVSCISFDKTTVYVTTAGGPPDGGCLLRGEASVGGLPTPLAQV